MTPRAARTAVRRGAPADREAASAARTIVLGLGNPLLSDDAAGLHVVACLRAELAGLRNVEVGEDYWGGLRLMERLIGYQRAIIVDARLSGAPPGTVSILTAEAPPTRHGASAHDVDLWTALEFGRRAGAAVPLAGDIRIVAIEAADVETFGEQCTPAVAASLSRAVAAVRSLLADWR